MFELNPNTPSEMITGIALVCEAAAYIAFYHLGKTLNASRQGKWNIGPRGLGCIAVVVVGIWLVRFVHDNLVDDAVYMALSAREQGEYLGRLLRSVVIPAIMIIGVSATRAWRDKQQRIAQARGARV